MAPFIRLTALTKKFNNVVAVDDLSLDIDKGDLFCLLGASGCGKSTLLRMLAGFEQPTAGTIEIDGQNMAGVAPADRPVNIMFQNYALFPHMTVNENLMDMEVNANSLFRNRLPGSFRVASGMLVFLTFAFFVLLSGPSRTPKL